MSIALKTTRLSGKIIGFRKISSKMFYYTLLIMVLNFMETICWEVNGTNSIFLPDAVLDLLHEEGLLFKATENSKQIDYSVEERKKTSDGTILKRLRPPPQYSESKIIVDGVVGENFNPPKARFRQIKHRRRRTAKKHNDAEKSESREPVLFDLPANEERKNLYSSVIEVAAPEGPTVQSSEDPTVASTEWSHVDYYDETPERFRIPLDQIIVFGTDSDENETETDLAAGYAHLSSNELLQEMVSFFITFSYVLIILGSDTRNATFGRSQ